ncbi:hypothetical protein MNQ98_15930 [Paenibacillus sp. N3/727]|uniref:hypothetical protein n=1 Tax=Paenibacillus sp. N3/727 TaxID=2925845 RepID=UPI001F53CAD0|nr:hypothetical protein [Paenibacillus sp. N3/727]UNK16031.1 hypothetical protein MNQ98_15930 [Paenibacillus sp. N3/727]
MSPSLSRENFFITVINQFEHHQVKFGSLEQKLQELILDIAQAVQNKLGLNTGIIQRINCVFKEYQAIQLKVGIVSKMDSSPLDESENGRTQEEQQQILLCTEFIDEPHQLRRIYMESLISLLEAMEKNRLELQRCTQCNNWFIPYQRAQITKFCSSKCRNRYNYVITKEKKQNNSSEEIKA